MNCYCLRNAHYANDRLSVRYLLCFRRYPAHRLIDASYMSLQMAHARIVSAYAGIREISKRTYR